MGETVEMGAFERGFVFWEHNDVERFGPPADDQSRREWLDGFNLAFADYPDDPFNPEEGETAADALNRMLAGHPALPSLLMMLRPC